VIRARYPRIGDLTSKVNDEKKFQLRVNSQTDGGSVPFAALIERQSARRLARLRGTQPALKAAPRRRTGHPS